MKSEIPQIIYIRVHHFKLLSQVKSIQDEKVRLNKGNELKLTQDELHSFFLFLRVSSEIVEDVARAVFHTFSLV